MGRAWSRTDRNLGLQARVVAACCTGGSDCNNSIIISIKIINLFRTSMMHSTQKTSQQCMSLPTYTMGMIHTRTATHCAGPQPACGTCLVYSASSATSQPACLPTSTANSVNAAVSVQAAAVYAYSGGAVARHQSDTAAAPKLLSCQLCGSSTLDGSPVSTARQL
jgi:hypothetical protein